MYDKQVRRRRATLLALVAVSLILLTAYFGESPSSPLHSVQRGIVEVLSPVQAGASTVLGPVRDIAGWFGDNFSAKAERDRLRRQVAQLRRDNAQLRLDRIQNEQLTAQVGLDTKLQVSNYKPVAAQIIARDPSLWYAQVEIDKGSSDGLRAGEPVTGDGALVGVVKSVGPNFALVTQITDHSFAATATVLEAGGGDTGVLRPKVGDPSQLLVTDLPQRAAVKGGEQVVTAGFKSGGLESLFPPGIPIGTVTDPNPQSDLVNNQWLVVKPAADLRHLDVVQVLTVPHPAVQLAQATTPAGG